MGGINANANYHDQKKLMALQLRNQKELNEYNQQLAMKFWEDTNYNAQREQMEKAGLNVGLMYGGQGQGGQTMNMGGNASIGSIEGRNGLSGMSMQIGADVALKMAQAKNIEAQTKKLEGVDTEEARTRIDDLLQGIENKKAQEQLIKAEILIREQDYEKAISEVQILRNDAQISENTIWDKVMLIRRQAVRLELENALTIAETKLSNAKTLLTNEQKRAISVELAQEWERLSNQLDQIGTEKHRNAINEFTAKVNAELGRGNLELRKSELGANVVNGLLKKRK